MATTFRSDSSESDSLFRVNQINRYSRILSFDPGFTTGISFLLDGKFIFGMAVDSAVFDRLESQINLLENLTYMANPTVVVIELPPTRGKFNMERHYEIYNSICKWYGKEGIYIAAINPGQWKKLVKRSQIDSGHIRDATDMATWLWNSNNK